MMYGTNHYLLTDPLNVLWGNAVPRNQHTGEGISDIYIMAHGWNFTPEEAVANYHGYLALLDRQLSEIRLKDPSFNPYFLFVVWPSATRPTTDLARSILPFGWDYLLRPATLLLDGTVFFIPSAWKQASNARRISMGTRREEVYTGAADTDGKFRSRSVTGFWPKAPPSCGTVPDDSEDVYGTERSEIMGRDCPLSLLIKHVISWKDTVSPHTRIHLVGHSFGARVITLAAQSAIHALESSKHSMLNDAEHEDISSLVLLNPAFEPFTLSSPKTKSWMDNIKRKVVVYSDRDYATGRLYDLSQMMLNYELVTSMTDPFLENDAPPLLFDASYITLRLFRSTLASGLTLAFSPIWWGAKKLILIPGDLVHHVATIDTYVKKQESSSLPVSYARGLINGIDFFVPILHLFRNDPADQLGILRNSSAALGSTGLNRAIAGRVWANKSLVQYAEQAQTPPELFCAYGLRISKEFPIDPNVVNSFDGTSVLDTTFAFEGAHGDVRSSKPPANCRAMSTRGFLAGFFGRTPYLEKRELVFNFIYNVTQGSLVPSLRSKYLP